MKMRNQYAEHAHKFPPRCITHLNSVPVVDLPVGVDFASVKADFKVGCPCGEVIVQLLGYDVEAEAHSGTTVVCDPLAVQCPKCQCVTELFDSRQYGFDGEYDVISGYEHQEKWPPDGIERENYLTPCCGQAKMELIAGFGYSISDFDGDENQRTQDFFDWFSLCGRCISCDLWHKITDVECA